MFASGHLRAEGNLLGQGHSGQLREKGQSVGTLVKIPVVFESERTLCQEEDFLAISLPPTLI